MDSVARPLRRVGPRKHRLDSRGVLMTETIRIDPSRLSQFGPATGSTFCLVTNPELADVLEIVPDGPYEDCQTVLFGPEDRFEDVLAKRIPEPAHVLVVSPHHFFQSPDDDL